MKPAERSLATILFTDIVGSTERAFQLGDRELGEIESAKKFIAALIRGGETREEIWADLGELIKEATRLGFDTPAELEEFFASRISPIDLGLWGPRARRGLPGMGATVLAAQG